MLQLLGDGSFMRTKPKMSFRRGDRIRATTGEFGRVLRRTGTRVLVHFDNDGTHALALGELTLVQRARDSGLGT
jgi:hypothetical protein